MLKNLPKNRSMYTKRGSYSKRQIDCNILFIKYLHLDIGVSGHQKEVFRVLSNSHVYPRRESNPYPHFCRQDFKSCASTCSATRVCCQIKNSTPFPGWNSRAEDRARTGHLDLGKVALYQMS